MHKITRGSHAGAPNARLTCRHATTTTIQDIATRGNSGWFSTFSTRLEASPETQYWIPNVVLPRIAAVSRNPNPSRVMNVPGILCSNGVSMAPSERSHKVVRRLVLVRARRRFLTGSTPSSSSVTSRAAGAA